MPQPTKPQPTITIYPDGIVQPHTTYGFILIGPCPNRFQSIGVSVSHAQSTPQKALAELLGYNRTKNEGMVNVKLIQDGALWRAYADRITTKHRDEDVVVY